MSTKLLTVKDLKIGDVVEVLDPVKSALRIAGTQRIDPKTGAYAYNTLSTGIVENVMAANPSESYRHMGYAEFTGMSEEGNVTTRNVSAGWRNSSEKVFRLLTAEKAKEFKIKMQKAKTERWWEAGYYVASSGADPEVFVEVNGNVIPAFEFLPGKDNPLVLDGQRKLYWDGFQAEYTVQPQSCHERLCNEHQTLLRRLNAVVKTFSKDAQISTKSVIEVPEIVLEGADKQHVALGCDPSLNAYGEAPVEVEDPRKLNLRFAGGHVHIGWYVGQKASRNVIDAVKCADLFAAIPVIGMLGELEDPRRRKFYGRAGEYRLPEWGLEYRVHSNGWLRHPSLYYLTFDLTRAALNYGSHGIRDRFPVKDEVVQQLINDTDVEGCRKLVADNKPMFERMWMCGNKSGQALEAIHKIVAKGATSFFSDLNDIYTNWNLGPGSGPAAGKVWYTAAGAVLRDEKIW